MAILTVVNVWYEASSGLVYGAGWVDEGPPWGRVEYVCTTPYLDGQGAAKPNDQVRAELLAALAARRQGMLGTPAPVAGYDGQQFTV